MKKPHLAVLFLLVGCQFSMRIQTGSIVETLEKVLDRYESYVEANDNLFPEQFEDALAQIAEARELLTQLEISGDQFKAMVLPLLDRHDAMVRADDSLTELERGIFLRSTALLRTLVQDP